MSSEPAGLLWDFCLKEIRLRHRGTFFGWTWHLWSPLLMLGVYFAVFSGVLGLHRIENRDGADYAVWLCLGLTAYFFLSAVISRAPESIARRPQYVKKIIFPLQVLVLSDVAAVFLEFMIHLALLSIVLVVIQGGSWAWGWLPLVLGPAVMMACGFAFALSGLGPYWPDLKEITPSAVRLLFFLSPIAYPLSQVPERFQSWFWLNPLTALTELLRRILLEGRSPDLWMLAALWAFSLAVLGVGFYLFQKLRPALADVL